MAHPSNRGFTLKALIALVLLVTILLIGFPPAFSTQNIQTSTILVRTVPMTIKVILVGFDPSTIDLDYLNWRGNTLQTSMNNVLDTGNITGINYKLTYEYVFPQSNFEQSLTDYLTSIQSKKLEYNPWFKALTTNYFYDAGNVEQWLIANNASYGGFPKSGYVLMLTNMTNLPSVTEGQLQTENPANATPHYYSTHFSDTDLSYNIRYREFSIAWGGTSRLWFVDLAAGPEFWTWSSSSGVPHIPIQLALDLFKLNVHNSYGKQWLTQYLADYLYSAVQNLAIPVFVYQPIYSQSYRIVVNIIDNRTSKERDAVPIEGTFHNELVKKAFTDLLPYSNVQVETHFITASDNPNLQSMIAASTITPPSDLGISPYVDTRPIYRYLEEHISEFAGNVRRDDIEVTIPVFGFAFASGIYFGYTYEWYVALKSYDANFLGISLGDLVLIGMSQTDFQRGDTVSPAQPGKGIGFTQAVIHEAGHSLGLMHPHQFGYLEDFVSSPMSYWSYDYTFSQFDKDAVNRSHVDQLVNSALSNLATARELSKSSFDFGLTGLRIAAAQTMIDTAMQKYDSMEYGQAVQIAAVASQEASTALQTAMAAPNGVIAVGLISLILGIIIGSSVIFIAFSKQDRRYTKIH